ncbi:dockerin type I cellulosome protein [Acetivibrio thermocellus BC1]|nr:dockerin type I cellulosome protein [Acetivibrio thermocellus BC1]
MKKKIALLTVVLIVAMVVLGGSMTAYAGHQCSVTVIIGDVNLDGSVDSIDLALLYNTTYYAVPLPNRLQYIAADVNYDSSCTMLDFYMLEDYLLGRISSFPAGQTYTVYYGDLNGEQLVTTTDQSLLSDYLLGRINLTFRQYVSADVNGDGTVDGIDLAIITAYINGQIQHFPVCPQS